jgi:hypothetical protein
VLSGSCSFLPFTTQTAKDIVNRLTNSPTITTTKEDSRCFVELFNSTLTGLRWESLDFLGSDSLSHLFLSLNVNYSMALDTFNVWNEIR